MKSIFVVLAIFGLSCGGLAQPVLQTRTLSQDLDDFIALLPIPKIVNILIQNLDDPEVQAAIDYVFSDDCKSLVKEMEAIPEYDIIFAYLKSTGLPVEYWREWIHDLIGISRTTYSVAPFKGINGLIQEIKAVLPLKDLEAMFNDKLKNSPSFKELIEKVRSPVFSAYTKAVKANKRVLAISARLRAVGVDVDKFIAWVKEFLGLNFARDVQVRGLYDDLRDFVDLLPADEIIPIVMAGLSDPEVQAALAYIFSEDFKQLVIEIEAIPEYKLIVAYLDKSGVPVLEWIQTLHDILDIDSVKRQTLPRGLNSIIQQIKAVIPFDKFEAMYNDKLKNSPAFKEMIGKLHTPEFKRFTDAVAANKRVQAVSARLKAVGVDVDKFIAWLKDIFDLKF